MCYNKNTRKHRRRLLPQISRNNRQFVESLGGYFFLFCISITNFTTASTKVPSRRRSSKVMYIGHHLPPENPEEEKEIFTSSGQGGSNRHRQAVPAPNRICRVQTLSALRLSQQSDMRSVAWCFQGHGFLRGFFIIHPRRRFVKTAFKKPLRRAFSLSAGVCLRGAVCCQIVPDTVSVAVPGVVTQTPSVPCAKVAAGTVIRPGTVANTPVVSL